MRDIKFRGKGVDNGKWEYGSHAVASGCYDLILKNGFSFGFDYNGISNDDWCEVFPETVGEFTGLKDKDGKGKEMFEGDIFKDWLGQLSVIVWKEFRWAFETINEPSFKYRANFHNIGEVIGNKYDNIELLERGGN